jgi:hypothetical protein
MLKGEHLNGWVIWSEWVKQVTESKVEGWRVGRPRLRWLEDVENGFFGNWKWRDGDKRQYLIEKNGHVSYNGGKSRGQELRKNKRTDYLFGQFSKLIFYSCSLPPPSILVVNPLMWEVFMALVVIISDKFLIIKGSQHRFCCWHGTFLTAPKSLSVACGTVFGKGSSGI